MKGKMLLAVGIMVLAVGLVGTPASWANSLTVTDGTSSVTFALTVGGGGTTLSLAISSTTGITTNLLGWQGVNGFAAFEVKNVGNVTFTNPTALPGWTFSDDSLNDNGCISGNTTGGCFVRNAGPIA